MTLTEESIIRFSERRGIAKVGQTPLGWRATILFDDSQLAFALLPRESEREARDIAARLFCQCRFIEAAEFDAELIDREAELIGGGRIPA